nr:RNA-directed DNA polymerase, eukaryota, reverse transcriptase zinc-binding domain protein [Tanacetum cinerariifolium]
TGFRPISLIGAQYKIIAKVLANRLAKVIDSMISQEQTTFIKNRQILDGPLMLNRGLRQGDPLYPFLFIIAMEGLHVALEDAIDAGLYRSIKVNNLPLSHLFFVDDALFVGEWSRDNIRNIVAILECFHRASDLKINLHKSNLVGVGVPFDEVNDASSITSCNAMNSPFTYLGLPVDCNMAKVKSWDPILDKFSKRLSYLLFWALS